MSTIEEMRFHDVVEKLRNEYGHQELWLASGLGVLPSSDIAYRYREWTSAKILKRNGSMVAEQQGKSDRWLLQGNYRTPYTGSCVVPYAACVIDPLFRTYMLLG